MFKVFDTFRKRVALLTGSLLLILSLVLVTSFYRLASSRLSEASGVALVNISQSISNMLYANLIEREREVLLLSKRSSLYQDNNLSELQKTIDQIKNSYKNYAWIGFANVDGTVLASSNGLLKGADVSKRPWFIEGHHGAFIGDVHKALLLESLLPKPADGKAIRFVDFSAPVKDENGVLKGIVATHADWAWVREVLFSSLTEASKQRGIDIFILDKENHVLYPDNTASETIDVPRELPNNGQFTRLDWGDGETYLTSLVEVQSPQSTHLGWQILVRQPLSIAMQTVTEVHRWLIVFGAIATIFFMVIAYRFSSTLSRPLERLAQTAKSIQQGNRKATFHEDSHLSEVVTLSDSLQGMMTALLEREQSLMQMNLTLESKVKNRTSQLEASNRSLEAIIRKDPLTDSYNRLALDEALQKEYQQAQNPEHCFAVVMVDADHFKKINDTYGHSVGDLVLKRIAKLLTSLIGLEGMVARFGGEEFTVLLSGKSVQEAEVVAEQMREALEKEEMHEGLYVTASFGVAVNRADDCHYEQVLKRADAALYRAKEQGRNRVEVSA